jgi:hypothetical protein
VAREAHRGDPQQVSIQQPKHITQYSEADYWIMLIYTAMCIVEITVLAVGLRKQLEPGERHSFFLPQICARKQIRTNFNKIQ